MSDPSVTVCAEPGCPWLTRSNFCPKHRDGVNEARENAAPAVLQELETTVTSDDKVHILRGGEMVASVSIDEGETDWHLGRPFIDRYEIPAQDVDEATRYGLDVLAWLIAGEEWRPRKW